MNVVTSGIHAPEIPGIGNRVYVYVDDPSGVASGTTGFTITVNGSPVSITSISLSGSLITLFLSLTVWQLAVVTLDYAPGDFTGIVNGPLNAISSVSVTNNSVQSGTRNATIGGQILFTPTIALGATAVLALAGSVVFTGVPTVEGAAPMSGTASLSVSGTPAMEGSGVVTFGESIAPQGVVGVTGYYGGTALWKTGRDSSVTGEVPFSMEFGFAPIGYQPEFIGGSLATPGATHWTKYSRLFASVAPKYRYSPTPGPTDPYGNSTGPYVQITPYIEPVVSSWSFHGNVGPYPPWTDGPTADRPNISFNYGWVIDIYMGDSSNLSTRRFTHKIPVGTGIAWGVNPLGSGLGPFYTTDNRPDDWERTGGPLYTGSLSGTIKFVSHSEEFFQNIDARASYNSLFQASELGENPAGDPYPPYGRQYLEQPTPGTTFSIEVAIAGGATYTHSESQTPARAQSVSTLFVNPFVFVHSLGSAGADVTSSVDVTGASLYRGAGPGSTAAAGSVSGSGATATESGVTATTVTVPGSVPSANGSTPLIGGGQTIRAGVKINSAQAYLKIEFNQEVVVQGELDTMTGANTQAMDLIVHNNAATTPLATLAGVTAGFSHTFSKTNCNSLLQAGAASGQFPSSDWSGLVGAATFPASLGVIVKTPPANVDRPRLCLRGWSWDLWTAVLPEDFDIGLTWSGRTAAAGLTTGVSGTTLSITVPAGSASTWVRLGSAALFPEVRYHKIKLRSVGAGAVPVRIRRVGAIALPPGTSYDWSVVTGAAGVWSEVLLDPYAGFEGPSLSYAAQILGRPNGFSTYWQIEVAAGATVEIEYFKGVVNTFEHLDIYTTYYPFQQIEGVVDGVAYALQMLPSDQLTNAFNAWVLAAAAAPGSKPWGHVLPFNANVGGGTYDAAKWYDADNYVYALGMGLMLTPSATRGVNLGIDPATGRTLKAQEILEWVQLYPGCGDVFGGPAASFGESTTLNFGLLLGQEAVALEVGEEPGSGVWPDVVAYKTSDMSEQARGTPGGDEHWARLAPALRHGVGHTLKLDPDDYDTILDPGPTNRTLLRTLWLVQELLADPLTVDVVRRRIVSAFGKRLRAYAAEDRTLESTSAEHPPSRWISLDVDRYTRQLWALGKVAGELVLYASEDFGNTIWEVGRVTAKSGVVIADPVRGAVVVYYEDASGHVQQLLRLANGTTIGPTAVSLAGVALTAKVLSGDTDEWSAGRHLLKIKQAGVVKVIAGQDLAGATFEPWIT